MLEGGELDVLTGDYLAELTMLLLWRDTVEGPRPAATRRPSSASLRTASGLRLGTRREDRRQRRRSQPVRAAPPAIREIATPRAWYFGSTSPTSRATTSARLSPRAGLDLPLAANAYLGGWGIAECLDGGRTWS